MILRLQLIYIGSVFGCLVNTKFSLWTILRLRFNLQGIFRKGNADIAKRFACCPRLHHIAGSCNSNSCPNDIGYIQPNLNLRTTKRCK